MLVVTRGQFNTPLPLLLREGKQNTQNIKHEYTYIKKKWYACYDTPNNASIHSLLSSGDRLNPFITETHFYHEFWVWLDDLIDIRKDIWRLEDEWVESVLF